jgi:hypothetical protein
MKQSIGESGVCSRRNLQMQRGSCRSGSCTRVDNDQGSAIAFLLLEVLHYRRHRFRYVAANQEYRACLRNVGQREGKAAIHSERFNGRGRC